MIESRPHPPALREGDHALERLPLPEPQPGLTDLSEPGSFIAGALLGLYALKRRDLGGLFAAGIGAGLLYRGAQQNGLLNGGWLPRLLHTKNRRLVPFERQIIIDRSPSDVFQFWRNLENLAIFLPHVRDVKAQGDGLSKWQLKLTDSLRLNWTAELVEEKQEKLLVWRTREPSDLYHEGWLSLEPLRDHRSTRMTIRLYILAPGGSLGARAVEWLEELPLRYFTEDLQRFRNILESGSYPEDDSTMTAP